MLTKNDTTIIAVGIVIFVLFVFVFCICCFRHNPPRYSENEIYARRAPCGLGKEPDSPPPPAPPQVHFGTSNPYGICTGDGLNPGTYAYGGGLGVPHPSYNHNHNSQQPLPPAPPLPPPAQAPAPTPTAATMERMNSDFDARSPIHGGILRGSRNSQSGGRRTHSSNRVAFDAGSGTFDAVISHGRESGGEDSGFDVRSD